MRLISLLPILFCACVSLREVSIEQKLNDENLSDINGRFVARSDSSGVKDLASFIKIDNFLSRRRLFSDVESQDLEITLQVLSHHSIRATVYRNDTIENSFKLKGKLNNNSFEIRKQRKFNCDGPLRLFPCLNRQKTRLYLSADNKLIIDSESKETCFILFIPEFTYHREYYSCPFGRVEQ